MYAENFLCTIFCLNKQKYARRTKFFYATYKQGELKQLLFANKVVVVLEFHIYRFAGYEHYKDRDVKKQNTSQVGTKL